jgi:serine/threonine-protein kinase ULK/ATG1
MHRDFKPSNVLVHNGKIKIADFGFSKLLGNKSHTRTILGSPLNMAPEVMEGKPYGYKADVWSVGVTFYELLFGDHPWKAKTLSELLENIKETPLVFPDNVKIGDTTKDILKRMMVVDAGSRASWTECFEHDIANLKI